MGLKFSEVIPAIAVKKFLYAILMQGSFAALVWIQRPLRYLVNANAHKKDIMEHFTNLASI